MKIITYIVFFVCIILANQLEAGEYGLIISDAAKSPCEADVNYHLNTCTSIAVRDDLNRFFIENQDFRIKAVRMGYWSGIVHFEGENERKYFYESLVLLLASQELKKVDELERLILRYPFRSMRIALENELSKDNHPEFVEKRLKRIYKCVIDNHCCLIDFKIAKIACIQRVALQAV